MEGPREAALRCRDLGHSGRSAMGRDDLTLLRPRRRGQGHPHDYADSSRHSGGLASSRNEPAGATGGGEPPGFAAGPPAG